MPPPSSYQLSCRSVSRHSGYHPYDFTPVGNIHKVKLHLCVAYTQEMTVAIDEAWDSQLPVKIDDLRTPPDVVIDLFIGSYSNDRISLDRDGLTVRNCVVDRHHFPAT
jgi:hypothetical protein